jgi:hypothetical protein
MSRICDRSPCDGLLDALGNYIFGSNTDDGKLEGFVLFAATKHPNQYSKYKLKKRIIEIEYCPFCGTRIEEIQNVVILDRFMRPRRRRRTKYDIIS